jgi:hypothetical protein
MLDTTTSDNIALDSTLSATSDSVDYLPRLVRIDWLRFQFESYSPWLCLEIQQLINLPFEALPSNSNDKNVHFRALNKTWDNIFEFQSSQIGIKKPVVEGEAYKYFVNLNGKTLACLSLDIIVDLLAYCQKELSFIGNRIDVALDFPPSSPRLFYRDWEVFINNNLIFGYRSIMRISNIVNNCDESTIYLGSRESEKFVRIYPKKIGEENFDRLEVEFKRGMAEWIMESLTELDSVVAVANFLNGVAIKQVEFRVFDSRTDFFKVYQFGAVYVPPTKQHLDIERSIAFIERHSATFAMIREYMGVSEFQTFMANLLVTGKNKMKFRHYSILKNAKLLGSTAALFLLFFLSFSSAVLASNLVCPAPVPLSLQVSQKFPIDIVQPTPAEQGYFDAVGDGCFQINSGLNFDRICLPGMIVNALRPFVIMGLGLRFIFSD